MIPWLGTAVRNCASLLAHAGIGTSVAVRTHRQLLLKRMLNGNRVTHLDSYKQPIQVNTVGARNETPTKASSFLGPGVTDSLVVLKK